MSNKRIQKKKTQRSPAYRRPTVQEAFDVIAEELTRLNPDSNRVLFLCKNAYDVPDAPNGAWVLYNVPRSTLLVEHAEDLQRGFREC